MATATTRLIEQSSGSFRIYYRGGLASDGLLEAESFAESLAGAARLYRVLAHYAVLGYVPRRHKKFDIYTKAAVLGRSVDQELLLQSLSHADLRVRARITS